ncbi:regulator of G-protein signaling 3-like [Lacerta agilis]|uniref:regulator of G-protein signaling 3-like n=1 Tax=Lacerta agilis TaxID=80427 RepID=UPI001419123F|nr:regulator of G-protein signaling 3-like [Lacerta agilis]
MKIWLGIFRRRNESPGAPPASKVDKALTSLKPTPEEAVKWGEALEKLLQHKYGLAAFHAFLCAEFSEENLEFWQACEDYKKIKSQSKMVSKGLLHPGAYQGQEMLRQPSTASSCHLFT